MPSSIAVLCTQPVPLWISDGLAPGYAPQGGAPYTKAKPLHAFSETTP